VPRRGDVDRHDHRLLAACRQPGSIEEHGDLRLVASGRIGRLPGDQHELRLVLRNRRLRRR